MGRARVASGYATAGELHHVRGATGIPNDTTLNPKLESQIANAKHNRFSYSLTAP